MSCAWQDFIAGVVAFVTDRKASEANFAVACAEYVRARMYRDLHGAADAYALVERRYTVLRKGLAGYQSTASTGALRGKVKELLRPAGSAETALTEAVAEFVRAKLAGAELPARYQALRLALAGFESGRTDAEISADVKTLLRTTAANDATYAQAAAAYAQAEMARVVGIGDYDAARKRYLELRAMLAGYKTGQTPTELAAAVRVNLGEGAATNLQFAQACALYARAEISREVDARDAADGGTAALALAESCRRDYLRARLRLVGFRHTLSINLLDEVKKFLPIDALRKNSGTYLASVVANAREDLESFGGWLDATIANAQLDLDAAGTWIDGQVAVGRVDIESLAGWLDAQVDAARDDLQALSERVQQEIRAGARDLMHYIRAYTLGHETTFTEATVVASGKASAGALEDQAQLREATLIWTDPEGVQDPREATCHTIGWLERRLLIEEDGDATVPRIALNPKGGGFIVSPAIEAPYTLRVAWDGKKLTFQPTDATPFDEDAMRAVALFVNANLCTEWGESAAQVTIWRGMYIEERSRLYLKHRAAGEVRP